MRLLPREPEFFRSFQQMAATLIEGATMLRKTLSEIESVNTEVQVQGLKDIEHEGDKLMHDVIDRLNKTFITPLDREDIHRLASSLDDVLDFVYAAGERVVMYDVRSMLKPSVDLADIIVRQTQQISSALDDLQNHTHVLKQCMEIRRLDREADRVSRSAIANLFKQEKDPITLIKHKELFEFLETATDRAEDVADVLESIVVKNA